MNSTPSSRHELSLHIPWQKNRRLGRDRPRRIGAARTMSARQKGGSGVECEESSRSAESISAASEWRWMRVDEVGDVQLGRQRSPKNRSADYPTKYLRAANITERGLDLSDVLEMDFNPEERERHRLRAGDIVLSEASGSASQVGKPAIWREELPLCCIQNTVIRLRPKLAEPEYLLWLFTHFYRNGVFAQVAGGVGINHLSAAKFKQLTIPVPPLPEQRRIVAEIEAQFTKLDAGVAALKRVQANLKRYRAAVLKAACEGKLVPTEAELRRTEPKTASIPREGATLRAVVTRGVQGVGSSSLTAPTKFETGEQLLQRILAERRRQWEEANPKSKTRNRKYQEPVAPDTTNLPPLPEDWIWARIEQLSDVVRGASPRPAGDPRYFGGDVPWITVGPLTADNSPYLKSVASSLNELGKEHSRFIEPHTLLLTNSGATLGVPKITLIGGCINDGVAALLNVSYPLKLYLVYFLHTQTARLRSLNQGAAQPNLNTTIIKGIAVPLPPLAEQTRIVAEVERRLSVIDELETLASTNLARATRLRQAVLQQEFSCQLI
jgi:type I restriction enzyme, S subunit